MQVIATKEGFYQGSRRRVGAIFDMDDKDIKADKGAIVKPSWVKAAPDANEARKEVAKAQKAAAEKVKAGAIAASGGAPAKAKVDAAQDLAG